MRLIPLLAAAAAMTACASAPAIATPPPPGSTVFLKGPNGEERGEALVRQVPTGVVIEVAVKGLTPGWHGMHIHEVGTCQGPGFTTAGSHVHHGDAREHGYLTISGGEAGDLPNIWVGADGTGHAQAYSDRLTLTVADGKVSLWDQDTAALVIHAAQDDHFTQPIGNSGARVACGKLTH